MTTAPTHRWDSRRDAGATSLCYIIHRGGTKDLRDDQSLDFSDSGYEVWVLSCCRWSSRSGPTIDVPERAISAKGSPVFVVVSFRYN